MGAYEAQEQKILAEQTPLMPTMLSTGVMPFGAESNGLQDVVDGTLLSFSFLKGAAEGVYEPIRDLVFMALKTTSAEGRTELKESMTQMADFLSAVYVGVKNGEITGDDFQMVASQMVALGKEKMEEISQLPPQEQSAAMGKLIGNIIGECLLAK